MDTSIIIEYLKALGGLPCPCPALKDFLNYKETLDKYKKQFDLLITNTAFEKDSKGIKYFLNEFEISMGYAAKHLDACSKENEEDPTWLCYQEAYSHLHLSVELMKRMEDGFDISLSRPEKNVSNNNDSEEDADKVISAQDTPYNINQRYVYHSFKEVCAAFPSLKLHKVRDRAWRKANNFPDGQDCRGGKCTFYHQQVADWIAENS